MPTGKLTKTIIEAAIAGFEAQKKSIDAEIAELRVMLTGPPESGAEAVPAKQTRRKFSAAARKRMQEAQRTRWAKIKGKTKTGPEGTPAEVKTVRPKPHFSAAARKALSDAMKKRWAAKRAGGQSALATKKAARKKAA